MRGRQADSPDDIPARGWWDILLRVKDEIGADHVGLIAAGIAFYTLLAIFPAITALMAIAGLAFQPEEITGLIDSAAALLPEEASKIILEQAVAVAGSREGGLGLALIVGVALSLYSASKGMASLIEGLNVAYDEQETRGFFRRTFLKLALTTLLMFGLIVGIAATLVVPIVLDYLPLSQLAEMLAMVARWVVLGGLTILGLAVVFRYGPARDDAKWRWITPGALVACAAWLVASIGFAFYVENFGSYNESFGSLAGVVILLMWLWISSFIILLGAELNAEIEAQTKADTTVGEPQPMGVRGAEKADNLGEAKAAEG